MLAEEWGVSPSKVRDLIASGQLRAINLARDPNGRPRYSISREDIAAFEQAREARPATVTHKKPRSCSMEIESFI